LAKNECFGDLYKSLQSGEVQISLDTLISIYQRQSARGHIDRLSKIKASCMSSWDVTDFQRFAVTASHSLTSLDLAGLYWSPSKQGQGDIAFSDLPAFIKIIKDSLVNLTELKMSIRGGETAEKVCGEMLDSGILEERGTLLDLALIAGLDAFVPFNSVRAISPLCAEGARTFVGPGAVGYRHGSNDDTQGRFLQVLRE
jgi:hypothetical protein